MRQGKPERPGLLRGQQQAQGTGDRGQVWGDTGSYPAPVLLPVNLYKQL